MALNLPELTLQVQAMPSPMMLTFLSFGYSASSVVSNRRNQRHGMTYLNWQDWPRDGYMRGDLDNATPCQERHQPYWRRKIKGHAGTIHLYVANPIHNCTHGLLGI
jgi:hypothetical protein